MKKLTTLFRLFSFFFLQSCLCSNALAQITYTSSNFASAGDSFLVTKAVTDSIGVNDYSITGANTSWDFSLLQPLSQSYDRYLSAQSTGYKLSFVTSCVAGGTGTVACNNQWNALVNLGHRLLDSIKFGSFSFSNVIQHYNKTSAVLPANVLGLTFGLSDVKVPFAIAYQRPDTIYRFPLAYGNKDSSTSRYSVDLTSLGISFIYKACAKRVNQIEGWGQLKTPYKTYASTLKLKTLIYSTDTVILNGTVIPVPATTSVDYSWFDNATKRPVLVASGTIVSGVTVITNAEYIDIIRCLTPIASFTKTPAVPYLDQGVQSVAVDFNNTTANADQHSWNFADSSSGVQNTSAAVNPTHTFNHSGTYQVTLVSCNSICQPLRCDTVTIPVVILDSSNVQADFSYYPLQPCGSDTVKFTNLSLNSTTYRWDFGDNTGSVLKNPSKIYSSSGTYTVTLISKNSTISDTISQQVIVLSVPLAEITPSGTLNTCNGDSVVLTASGGSYYLWSNGSVNSSITVKHSSTFTVKAFNNCGNSTSQPVQVNIHASPVVPVISQYNDTLISTPAVAYQWYYNDVVLNNSDTRKWQITLEGTYKVEITDSNGCKNISNAFNVISTTITGAKQEQEIKLFPNPTSGTFTLKFNNDSNKEIMVTDALGREVYRDKVSGLNHQVNLVAPAGMYFVSVTSAGNTKTMRLNISR